MPLAAADHLAELAPGVGDQPAREAHRLLVVGAFGQLGAVAAQLENQVVERRLFGDQPERRRVMELGAVVFFAHYASPRHFANRRSASSSLPWGRAKQARA